MLFHRLAETSADVAASAARNDKVAHLAATIADLGPDEVEPAVAFLSGEVRQGRIGSGWATVSRLDLEPATTPTLTVHELDSAFAELAAISGPGSVAARDAVIGAIMRRATAVEQRLIRALIIGELRQGALAGVVLAAVVAATTLRGRPVKTATLRRAVMLLGNLPDAAAVALGDDGPNAIDSVGLEVMRAVGPMLASTSTGVAEALTELGRASVEWKLDGARVQVHRRADEVRIFTRNLNDVTDRLPEVVRIVRSLPVRSIILDGEVLGLDADGALQPFQDTMSDFGTSTGPGSGLRPWFFDVLHLDGVDLLDQPLTARHAALESVAAEHRIPAVVTDDRAVAADTLAAALAAGHEGVMVKAVDGVYQAGRRGKSWRKVKPVHTYDLVVIGVERGNGRRTGTLSNLHLGARDPERGGFVMVGKTFKGLTDEILAWQTEALGALAVSDDGYTIMVRPELVVEIAIDGVQRSTRYPGGVALRFARVRRYRPDRQAGSADTLDTLRSLLR